MTYTIIQGLTLKYRKQTENKLKGSTPTGKYKSMVLAYASGDYSMKEISIWFGVNYSTMSRAVKALEIDA